MSLKKKLRHFSLLLGPSKQLYILLISPSKTFQPESNILPSSEAGRGNRLMVALSKATPKLFCESGKSVKMKQKRNLCLLKITIFKARIDKNIPINKKTKIFLLDNNIANQYLASVKNYLFKIENSIVYGFYPCSY